MRGKGETDKRRDKEPTLSFENDKLLDWFYPLHRTRLMMQWRLIIRSSSLWQHWINVRRPLDDNVNLKNTNAASGRQVLLTSFSIQYNNDVLLTSILRDGKNTTRFFFFHLFLSIMFSVYKYAHFLFSSVWLFRWSIFFSLSLPAQMEPGKKGWRIRLYLLFYKKS